MNQTSITHQRQAAERRREALSLARGAPHLGAPARSAPTHRRRSRGDEASGLTLRRPQRIRPPPAGSRTRPGHSPAGSISCAGAPAYPAAWEQ